MSMENKKLKIISSKCPQNHRCPSVEVCPVNALTQCKYEVPNVNDDLCIKCGKCTKRCPMGALIIG